MTDDDTLKGKFLFFPDNSDQAFEIDMAILLENLTPPTWWEKVKAFFGKKKKKKEEPMLLPTTEVQSKFVDLNELVCNKIEELLSTAKWYPKKHSTAPSLILKVYPGVDEAGWEPMVTIATPNGQAFDLGLSDLLFHYDPEVAEEEEELSRITNN